MSEDANCVRCVCNFRVEIPIQVIYRGGVAYICKCGRRYEPASVDFHALIKRDEELEARLAELEKLCARREIRAGMRPTTTDALVVDETLLKPA